MRKGREEKMKRMTLTGGIAVTLGSAALLSGLIAPSASADSPSEVYLGTASGQINVFGNKAHKYVDKQYRSTSLPNLRKHSIRVTYSGCGIWKARAAVKWGSSVDTDEQGVEGCNKSVLLTPMGDMKASVTLTIHVEPMDRTGSKSIKPVG
ncbi:hypothetical protein AB0H94_08830 [Streptomyces purpurascens]|uniref:hypothetical protein n=1 Tax=Streptomyces purpurascens TaxID=1924 RepID=UPI0033F05F6D